MVPNTLPGVDAQLDEEGLSVETLVICGNCKTTMQRTGTGSFKCAACGEEFTEP